MGRRFSSGFSKFRIPHHPCRQLPRIPLIRICYPDPSADCGRPPTCRMGFGIATALVAWLLLPPPPANRRARIHHDGSTRPAHQRSSTRAVPLSMPFGMGFAPALAAWLLLPPSPADRRARIHHDGSTRPTHQRSSTRAVPHARRSANARFDGTAALRLLPQSVTQPRRSGASAAAASDAGLADAAADGSWGTVYRRLSGVAAVVASLIVQVTARAPVRIGSAASQVRGLNLAAHFPQPHAPHPYRPPDGTRRRHATATVASRRRASAPRRPGRGCCWRCLPPAAAAPSALAAPPTATAATAATACACPSVGEGGV